MASIESPDGDLVVTEPDVLHGTHRGNVFIHGTELDVVGTVQGNIETTGVAKITLSGLMQGNVHLGTGGRCVITGTCHGNLLQEPSTETIVEAGATLAGTVSNDGVLIVRGRIAGPRFGNGETRFEGHGRDVQPTKQADGSNRYDL